MPDVALTWQDGDGYRLELPKKWIVEHARVLGDGLKIVKLAAAAGRLVGLPLPTVGLPAEIISKAEVRQSSTRTDPTQPAYSVLAPARPASYEPRCSSAAS